MAIQDGGWKNWLLGALSAGAGLIIYGIVSQVIENTARLARLEIKVEILELERKFRAEDEYLHRSERLQRGANGGP